MTDLVSPEGQADSFVWGIAFCDSTGLDRRWWHLFTAKGFEHCYCFREEGDGILLFNYLTYRQQADYLPVNVDDFAAYAHSQGHKVLFLGTNPTQKFMYRGLYYCVSAVEAMIGIKSRLAFTPKQLYLALRKQGAIEL